MNVEIELNIAYIQLKAIFIRHRIFWILGDINRFVEFKNPIVMGDSFNVVNTWRRTCDFLPP
jgi:hypothetical protein